MEKNLVNHEALQSPVSRRFSKCPVIRKKKKKTPEVTSPPRSIHNLKEHREKQSTSVVTKEIQTRHTGALDPHRLQWRRFDSRARAHLQPHTLIPALWRDRGKQTPALSSWPDQSREWAPGQELHRETLSWNKRYRMKWWRGIQRL